MGYSEHIGTITHLDYSLESDYSERSRATGNLAIVCNADCDALFATDYANNEQPR